MQRVLRRKGAVHFGLAHRIVVEIKFVAVMHQARSGRNRQNAFPPVGHQGGGTHRVYIISYNDLGMNGVPAKRLLAARHGHFNRILVEGVPGLRQGISESGRAAG